MMIYLEKLKEVKNIIEKYLLHLCVDKNIRKCTNRNICHKCKKDIDRV